MDNVIRFPVIKLDIPTNLMLSHSKLTTELCQRTFFLCFKKVTKIGFIEKLNAFFLFISYKNSNTNQFHVFTIKNGFENMSKSYELRLESNLKL